MNRAPAVNLTCIQPSHEITGQPCSRAVAATLNMLSIVSLAALSAFLLLLGGCSTPARESSPEISCTAAPEDTRQQLEAAKVRNRKLKEQLHLLQAENRSEKQQLLELRLQLAEKDSRNRQLQRSLDQAIQEVVSTKARVRNHYSKAGTVTDLAELKVELETAEHHALGTVQREWLARTRHYLEMADQALAAGNYEGSRYLANRARQALGQLKSLQSSNGSHGAAFPVPVVMETRIAGNVRRNPGLEAEILSTLPAGTRVSVSDRRGLWVKIMGPDGKPGWVHFSLLKVLPARDISVREPQRMQADS